MELIHAHSPQAKGRVVRMFNPFQDRLVKEITLREINTIEEANHYLKSYLSSHNKRFAVKPKEQNDLHREISKGLNLDKILCIRTEKTMRNDSTIAHKDVSLKFNEITARPEKQAKPSRRPCQRTGDTPSSEHPWRKSKSQLFDKRPTHQKKLIEVAA